MDWASAGLIVWEPRAFLPNDLEGVFLVIAATASAELNQLVFHQAQRRNILCNAVDDPENCDFYFPAVVRRGQLQIAISTAGQSPALAQRLRRELEEQFTPDYAGWLEELGENRKKLFDGDLDADRRRDLLHALASREAFDKRQTSITRSERSTS
jgi:precorrin-2 dehydrogenase/sirohydrochlorin ferrochelatase